MATELFIGEPEYEEHPYGEYLSFDQRYELYIDHFERQSGDQIEQVLRGVEGQIVQRCPQVAIIEGTPLYALPNPQYPDQSMDHPAAMAAMSMTDHVLQLLRSHGVLTEHWLFLDDVNNGASRSSQDEILRQFASHTGRISIYQDVQRRYFESDFQSSPDDTCAVMDAGFQREKIRAATQEYLTLDPLPLLINVHPASFQDQQRMMLERLRNTLKSDPYANALQVPKRVKNALSLDSFLHIWTDGYGNMDLTRPVINGNGVLEHQSLLSS